MTLDPVITWLVRIGLALLFASAAWHKSVDRQGFAASVDRYRLLPTWATRPVATALPALEIAVALGLLHGWTVKPAVALAVSLLGLYTVAMVINLRRGRRDLDCGCFGPSMRTPVHWGLVARNAALITATLAVALPSGDRTLGWVDLATLVCALIAGTLLWRAAGRLSTNSARLKGHLG